MKRALITVAVVFALSSQMGAETNVGKIIQIVNDVDITSLTTGRKIIPDVGYAVNTDHKIRTGKRSFAELLLNNGTRVQIRDVSVLNVSAIKVARQDPPTRIRLLTGKVRVSMKRLYRDGHSMILKTPTAVAGVRGTDFGVIASLLESKVIVFEGSLDIANIEGKFIKSYLMKDREECDIMKDAAPTRPRIVPEELLDSWFDRYDIDETNKIITKQSKDEGFIDSILRKRQN